MTFLETATALHAQGYKIVPIRRGKKGPTIDKWQTLDATIEDIGRWAAEGYQNIGVLASSTPAVDLDIYDSALADAMEAWIIEKFGWSPKRVGRAPKRMFVYRTAEPFAKITSAKYSDEWGDVHRVEILGHGQQFVAYGIHPDTQRPYEWPGESLIDLPFDDLPLLTPDIGRQIVAEFERRAAAANLQLVSSGGASRTTSTSTDPLDHLQPKCTFAEGELEEVIRFNKDYEDHDKWVQFGMALHHQFDGSDEGLTLWENWSKQGINYEPGVCETRWASFSAVRGGEVVTLRSWITAKNDALRLQSVTLIASLKQRIDTTEDIKVLLSDIPREMGESDLEGFDIEPLLHRIRGRVKSLEGYLPSLGGLRSALRSAVSGGTGAELEVTIARKVLDIHFDKGTTIKRFAQNWWKYTGGVWRLEDDEFMQRNVLDALLDLRKTKDKTLKTLIGTMDESRGDRLTALVNTISDMITKIIAEQTSGDPLNLRSASTPRVINTLNGELWFNLEGKTKFVDHNPRSNLTTQIACEYDDLCSCPTWDSALQKVFGTCDDPEEVIRHFHEVMGYLLQPTRDVALWMLFKGPGGNGKSFLTGIVAELMGVGTVLSKSLDEIATNPGNHFGESLLGKLMLLDDDLKKGVVLPDDWLKRLSEAKLLTADPKYAKSFEFTARAIPVVLSNHWPPIIDLSEGLRRRVQVFEATRVLPPDAQDPRHRQTIVDKELPGVLNRLVDGLVRFLKRGSRFAPPPECLESKTRWLKAANPTIRWLSQNTVAGGWSSGSSLYGDYENWARYWEHNMKALGRGRFYEALEALSVPFETRNNELWFGVSIVRRIDDSIFD